MAGAAGAGPVHSAVSLVDGHLLEPGSYFLVQAVELNLISIKYVNVGLST